MNKLRPITVLSTLYRMWSSMRYYHIEAWVASWSPMSMRGGVKHGETADCWLATASDVEQKFLGHWGVDMNLAGFVLDFVKAHNRIGRSLVFYVAEKLGLASVERCRAAQGMAGLRGELHAKIPTCKWYWGCFLLCHTLFRRRPFGGA